MEEALLGAMLESATARDTARVLGVQSSDWYRPENRHVFDAITALDSRGESVDVLTVKAELERMGRLAVVGGAVQLTILVEKCPSVVNAKAYAETVRQRAIDRELQQIGLDIAVSANEHADSIEALSTAEGRLAGVRDRIDNRSRREAWPADRALAAWWDEYTSEEPQTPPVPFPFEPLNRVAGGQRPGQVIITGAQSGEGKSWWGLACCESALEAQQGRVGVFSIEMPRQEIVDRLVAMGGIAYSDVLHRRADADVVGKRMVQLAEHRDELMIYDGATSVGRIQAALVQARIKGRPFRYILVDHLHLMDWGQHRDLRIAINEGLTRIKHMAVEHGVTIHLLAQLKRMTEDKVRPPRMSDFRESGGIENIADYALGLWRDRADDNVRLLNSGAVLMLKGRSAASVGKMTAEWDTTTYRFRPAQKPGVVGAVH